MAIFENEALLKAELALLDQKINQLDNQKITKFFEALGLASRHDIPQDYLNWETILIVVPYLKIPHELKQYKYSIPRITFMTNTYAREIHLYDLSDWKEAIRNKTRFEVKQLLKSSFGGVKKGVNKQDSI